MIVAFTHGAQAMPAATKQSPFPPPPLLSRRQIQLVEVVGRLTAEAGFPPSVREIAAAMGVHYSRVAQLIATTAARGAVTFDRGRARTVRVVHRTAR
jgi:SOS-response transcriptional repressor LexA